jgi:hypothetical protein
MSDQQQSINEIAQALQDGVNVYEHIGRLYIQNETNRRALGLAITALQALVPQPEGMPPATTEPKEGDILLQTDDPNETDPNASA